MVLEGRVAAAYHHRYANTKGVIMSRILIAVLLLQFTINIVYAEDKLASMFSEQKANDYLKEIRGELGDYERVMQKVRDNKKFKNLISDNFDNLSNISDNEIISINLRGAEIKNFGKISWEYQNIGYRNMIFYLERYIEFKNFEAKKLELESAIKYQAPKEEVTNLKNQVEEMQHSLMSYFDDSMWAD